MTMDSPTQNVPLSEIDCVRLIGTHSVGRLGVIDNGYPIALPVNYRVVVGADDSMSIVIRVRRDSVLDQRNSVASFEIDEIDHHRQIGWSVVARGTLHHVDDTMAPQWLRSWDPRPWVNQRDIWLYLEVKAVSGRQLLETNPAWAFEVHGYL
jgi:nitroimidazol reductase NimA-like FMN-containing flavoprotein (pyridoxamine 5'-phosphate oxidase superfamily)